MPIIFHFPNNSRQLIIEKSSSVEVNSPQDVTKMCETPPNDRQLHITVIYKHRQRFRNLQSSSLPSLCCSTHLVKIKPQSPDRISLIALIFRLEPKLWQRSLLPFNHHSQDGLRFITALSLSLWLWSSNMILYMKRQCGCNSLFLITSTICLMVIQHNRLFVSFVPEIVLQNPTSWSLILWLWHRDHITCVPLQSCFVCYWSLFDRTENAARGEQFWRQNFLKGGNIRILLTVPCIGH